MFRPGASTRATGALMLGLLLALVALGACSSGTLTANREPRSTPVPAAVLATVSRSAQAADGPTHGNARFVLAHRGSALEALDIARMDDEQPVYVFALRGSFVARNASVPPGADPPSGHGLVVFVSRAGDASVLDVGVEPTAPDLRAAGTVHSTRY